MKFGTPIGGCPQHCLRGREGGRDGRGTCQRLKDHRDLSASWPPLLPTAPPLRHTARKTSPRPPPPQQGKYLSLSLKEKTGRRITEKGKVEEAHPTPICFVASDLLAGSLRLCHALLPLPTSFFLFFRSHSPLSFSPPLDGDVLTRPFRRCPCLSLSPLSLFAAFAKGQPGIVLLPSLLPEVTTLLSPTHPLPSFGYRLLPTASSSDPAPARPPPLSVDGATAAGQFRRRSLRWVRFGKDAPALPSADLRSGNDRFDEAIVSFTADFAVAGIGLSKTGEVG